MDVSPSAWSGTTPPKAVRVESDLGFTPDSLKTVYRDESTIWQSALREGKHWCFLHGPGRQMWFEQTTL